MTDGRECTNQTYLPKDLIKFGTFDWPRSETRQTLGHLFEKIKTGFAGATTSDAVDEQNLKSVSDDALRERFAERLTDCLIQMLDTTYLDWSRNKDGAPMRRAFVCSPTSSHMLADWALRHDLTILKPDDNLDEVPREACIVIPRLEAFFSRHYDQLADLFNLFGKLAEHNGKVLVGCNSWAWKFLKQFDDAHLLFEDQKTFPAFDADALATITQSALSSVGNERSIKSIKGGGPILSRDTDGDLDDDYFEDLAGRSLGDPWVAMEMLFHSIAEVGGEKASADTTWIDLPKSCALPVTGSKSLMFALQALMIHGPRRIEELNTLLPHRVPNGTWTQLARAGFVEIDDGTVQCATRSYPDIRSELGTAGFNLDEL